MNFSCALRPRSIKSAMSSLFLCLAALFVGFTTVHDCDSEAMSVICVNVAYFLVSVCFVVASAEGVIRVFVVLCPQGTVCDQALCEFHVGLCFTT